MFIFYTIPYVIMYRDRTVGVVIPAYNEEALIKHTLDSIPPYVDKVYPVDDCSTDLTSDIILKHDDKRISPLLHETNQGVGAAIFTGYRAALKDDIDMIAVMAGDNQMDPVHLPLLLDEIIDNDIHYAKGNRLKENGHRCGMSMWRFLGNYILSVLTKISSGCWHISDPQNGYTVISSEAVRALDLDEVYPRYGYCNDLLMQLNVKGFSISDVSIPAKYGDEKSKIKYHTYIPKVSLLLLKCFFKRIKMLFNMRYRNID